MKDAPLTTGCPKCKKGRVKRKIGGGAGLIFKGSGFYETDYKRKSGIKGGGGSGEASTGAAKADTKPSTPAKPSSPSSS
jgi:predicted nucleic acid-binding Zn ribbon protein